jgi:hypothetical protein
MLVCYNLYIVGQYGIEIQYSEIQCNKNLKLRTYLYKSKIHNSEIHTIIKVDKGIQHPIKKFTTTSNNKFVFRIET